MGSFISISQQPFVNFDYFEDVENADDEACSSNRIWIPYPYYLNIDCISGGFHLIFNDEFDNANLFNANWNQITGVPRDFELKNQKAWHLPENNILNNGYLNITAKKLEAPYSGQWVTDWSTNPFTEKNADFDYTTGEIWSKYRFHYGVYEIRCKIPKGKGFWPAFWTYGGTVWNELDVFEFLNNYDILYNFDESKSVRNISTNYHHIANVDVEMDCSKDNLNAIDIDFSADFHRFTLIFDPGYIAWLVDGIPIRFENKYRREGIIVNKEISCEEIADDDKTYYKDGAMPEEPMFIVANLAIQNGLHETYFHVNDQNKAPDQSTYFPQALEIDYIRHWKKFDCPQALYFPNEASLNLNNQNVYNVIMGTNVTIENAIFDNGDQLNIIYSEYVEFNNVVEFAGNSEITQEYSPNFDCTNKGIIKSDENVYDVQKIKNDFYEEEKKLKESEIITVEKKAIRYVLYDLNGRIISEGEDLNEKNFYDLKKGMYIYIEFDEHLQIIKHEKLFF